MGDIYFPIVSQVYQFVFDQDIAVIKEVYKISPEKSHIVQDYGTWTETEGLTLSHQSLFERRKDLQGHIFRGETMDESPYVVVDMEAMDLGKVSKISGIMGDIWHQGIEKIMNFSTSVIPSPDRQWGVQREDGR